MAIPRFSTALYSMKKLLGRPAHVIGVTNKVYDRQNRTATISIQRVTVKRAVVTPINDRLTTMLKRENAGHISVVSTYVVVDISDLPVSFNRKSVQFIRYGGTTYNVDSDYTIEVDKAILYKIAGIANDPRFAIEETISQSISLAETISGVKS